MDRNRFPSAIPDHEVTDRSVFFNRRAFMQSAAVGLIGIPSACGQSQPALRDPSTEQARKLQAPLTRPDIFPAARNGSYPLPGSIDDDLTSRENAGSQNNYYEFLPGGAGEVWRYTKDFVVDPWSIEVTGECLKPMTFGLDDLFKVEHEERLYHFRCVERWSMNTPWSGFPLSKLLERVEPTSHATYVRFTTVNRPDQMPGLKGSPQYPWPYREGLRMDEAMNELAMVVTGVYGEPLLKQHGAPARIIVPWKYGYKNPKSIVRIELLRDQPRTFWQIQPHEYGFLSNVNPNIPHPRWSQSRSYMLGKDRVGRGGFDTPIYNGYGKYVAHLYPDEPTTPQTALRPGQKAR